MELFIVLAFLVIVVLSAVQAAGVSRPKTLEDLKVGDMIEIKGESFKIRRYSPGGVVEVERLYNSKDVYYIKTDENTKFKKDRVDYSGRIWYKVTGLKGTINGQELDLIKFEK
jgi:hypothetical protein